MTLKVACDLKQGGCGKRFELTDAVLEDFRRAIEAGETRGCPNPECSRRIDGKRLMDLLEAVEARLVERKAPEKVWGPWPGFPLTAPIVPDGRRKNGADPGISFRNIEAEGLDRPPTDEEIQRVQRHYAAQLEEGANCPCCTRYAQRQYRPLGCGPARWLIELVFLSDKGQPIHTGEVLKNLKGHHISGSDATSVLPLYGMIESSKEPEEHLSIPPPRGTGRAKPRTSGWWKPTKLGREFVFDRVRVPERVVTCLGIPEAFEGAAISIRKALTEKFDYDKIMAGRPTD